MAEPTSTPLPPGVYSIAVLPLNHTTVTATMLTDSPLWIAGVASQTITFRGDPLSLPGEEPFSLVFNGIADATQTAVFSEVSLTDTHRPHFTDYAHQQAREAHDGEHETEVSGTSQSSSTTVLVTSSSSGMPTPTMATSSPPATQTTSAPSASPTTGSASHKHIGLPAIGVLLVTMASIFL